MALFSRKSIIYSSVGLLMLCAGGCAGDVSLFQSSPSTAEAPTTGAPVETALNPDIDQVATPAPQRQMDGPSIELMKHYRAQQKRQETQAALSKATQEAGESAKMKQQVADEEKQLADTQKQLADAQQQAAAKDATITTMHDDLTTAQTALETAQKGEQEALEGKRTAEENNYKWIAATAGLGIAALFGLAAAGLFLWRKRKQASAAPLTFDPTDGSPVTEPPETIKPPAALDDKKPEDGEKATNIVLSIVPTPPPILPQAAPNAAGTPAAIPEWLPKPQNTPGNKNFPQPASTGSTPALSTPVSLTTKATTAPSDPDWMQVVKLDREESILREWVNEVDYKNIEWMRVVKLDPEEEALRNAWVKHVSGNTSNLSSNAKPASVKTENKSAQLAPLPWNQAAKPLSRKTFVLPEWLTEEARKLAAAKATLAVKAATAPETATTAPKEPVQSDFRRTRISLTSRAIERLATYLDGIINTTNLSSYLKGKEDQRKEDQLKATLATPKDSKKVKPTQREEPVFDMPIPSNVARGSLNPRTAWVAQSAWDLDGAKSEKAVATPEQSAAPKPRVSIRAATGKADPTAPRPRMSLRAAMSLA